MVKAVDETPFPIRTVNRIRRNLLKWYEGNQRSLPWRETRDPYCIWVSEVMLQQTQVKTVVNYYRAFLERFPTVEALAAADQETVLKLWEGMGYYARARNLHRAAGIVTREYNGMVPDTYPEFRLLPGVGDYIAAAVQSIAFNHPFAVVDGNVKRVLARLACIDNPVNVAASHKVFKAHATRLLDTSRPETFNQAVMELGALVCKPDTPDCPACPVSGDCRSFRTQSTHAYPVRRKTAPTPTYRIAVGITYKRDKMLITRRASEGLLGGLWEFPGGKIRPGEKAAAACIREIREETGIEVEIVELLTRVKHAYTHFKIKMDVFICQYIAGEIELNGPEDHRWITSAEISRYPFPKANHKFFRLLASYKGLPPATLGSSRGS